MTTDNHTLAESSAARTPRKQLRKLAELSPIHHVLPRSTSALVAAIVLALVIVVLAAVALGTPAAEILKSYTNRLWDLMF